MFAKINVGWHKHTKQNICTADDIVFVHIDPETRKPTAHGKTKDELDDFAGSL